MIFKKINIFILWFLVVEMSALIKSMIKSTDPSEQCTIWSKKHIFNTSNTHYLNMTSILVEFKSFDELNVSVCANLSYRVEILRMYPYDHLMLDNSLDISQFLKKFQFPEKKVKFLVLYNIKGFTQATNKSTLIHNELSDFVVSLEDSYFDFYFDGRRRINRELCIKSNFNRRSTHFFGSMKSLFMTNSPFYSKSVCPYVFANTNLQQVAFFQISNSLIYKNQLTFLDINETHQFDLNVNIKKVLLNLAYEKVSTEIINKHVFKYLQFLDLTGIVYGIQSDLFSHFTKIKLIILNIDNFQEFFQNGLKWMHLLNQDLNVNLSIASEFNENIKRVIIVQFFDPKLPFNKAYEYPDKDFCLFKDFPHTQLIYPSIIVAKHVECTCTIYWLIQYSKYYLNEDFSFYETNFLIDYPYKFESYSIRYCLKDIGFLNASLKCKFEDKLHSCHKRNSIFYHKMFELSGNLNVLYKFQWMQYLIGVIFQALFSLIAIFTNSLTIYVVRNMDKKYQKNRMYKHILVNSSFNILYSLLRLLSLMSICIYPRTSFCSRVEKYQATQYSRIYLGHLLENAVRLCCNFSYIFLSLSRFITTTKLKANHVMFRRIENLNVNRFYTAIFLVSILFSAYLPFQFKVNKFHSSFDKGYPFDAYGINYCETNFDNSIKLFFKCRLFSVLNVMNNVLNNIIFLFISACIDLFLIRFSNETLKMKLKLYNNQQSINEALKFRKNINKMILSYGILYFFSHILEFVTAILLLIYRKRLVEYCYYIFNCDIVIELAQAFNFLSISLLFFMYKRFDNNFRTCLKNIL